MANAQVQFTQGATVGGDGQSVIGFSSGVQVTMTDKGGAGATSYLWEVVNWPAPLSAAPTITNSTLQVATVTPTQDGLYLVRLTRTDSVSGTTRDVRFFGVGDAEGHYLPVAGASGNITNVGASPALAQAAGWMGREDAGTNVLLDAYLRWLKTAAKNIQAFSLVSGRQASDTNSWRVVGSLNLDPTGYPSYTQATFQVALSVTTGQSVEVRLYNVTDGEVVAASTVTSTSTTTEIKEATLTLPSAKKLYEAHLRLGSANTGSDEAVCSEARLLLADPTGATYSEVGHSLDADTISLWHFNEAATNIGNLSFTADASGGGRTLTTSAITNYNDAPGIGYGPDAPTTKQHCRWFTGTAPALKRVTDGTLAAVLTGDWSFEAWIYLEAMPSSDYMIIESGGIGETSATNITIQFTVTPTGAITIFWEYGAGVNYTFTTASTYITTGTWYHIALTCGVSAGNRTAKLYIDGAYKEQTTGTNAEGGTDATLAIGYSTVGSNRPFFGGICEARLSDVERSAVEIAASAATHRHAVDAGTFALWRMDEAPEVEDEAGRFALNPDSPANGTPIGYSSLSSSRCRIMNATDEYLRVFRQTTFLAKFLSDYTLEFWFRFTEGAAAVSGWTHGDQELIAIAGTAGESVATNYPLVFNFDTTKQRRPRIFWEYGAGLDVVLYPADAIFPAEEGWLLHHYAIVVEHTSVSTCTCTLYVDGVAITDYTDAANNPISNTGLAIPESTALGNSTLAGVSSVWEDMRLSSRARTASEILDSYQRRVPRRT